MENPQTEFSEDSITEEYKDLEISSGLTGKILENGTADTKTDSETVDDWIDLS